PDRADHRVGPGGRWFDDVRPGGVNRTLRPQPKRSKGNFTHPLMWGKLPLPPWLLTPVRARGPLGRAWLGTACRPGTHPGRTLPGLLVRLRRPKPLPLIGDG